MPAVKPKPGMTYDFEVDRLFNIDGATVLAGHPSADYEVLFPATAEMYVDGQYYKTLTIHSQEAFRRLNPAADTKRAITTPTILDKDYLEGKKINLQCTFKLTDDDR